VSDAFIFSIPHSGSRSLERWLADDGIAADIIHCDMWGLRSALGTRGKYYTPMRHPEDIVISHIKRGASETEAVQLVKIIWPALLIIESENIDMTNCPYKLGETEGEVKRPDISELHGLMNHWGYTWRQ
jgi:hypothetical protein